eukprot:m.139729 g.139729  ORF g.139729 m.139729 type:complete len:345 (+) comp16097_c0_seq2:90-1124(+)
MSQGYEIKTVWISSGPNLGLDSIVLKLWLQGYKVDEAVDRRADCRTHPRYLVEGDTRDNYDMFASLEPYLKAPLSLFRQPLFALSSRAHEELIAGYYSYDNAVMAEILDNPLSRGSRKDLDEVADKTGVTLKSCRRQFDNLRRVYKFAEANQGELVALIANEFALHEALARQYAAMVFISDNKLAIQKKALNNVTLPTFLTCAQAMFTRWTTPTMQLDLDKSFLLHCHELRSVSLDHLDDFKSHFASKQAIPAEVMQALLSTFSLAAGFSHTRDWRDAFEDIMQQMVQVFSTHSLAAGDAKALLDGVQLLMAGFGLSSAQAYTLDKWVKGLCCVSVLMYLCTLD